jgi:hypothetical protein
MMQGAKRTNPTAKEPSQEHRQHHGDKPPGQTGIERPGGEHRPEGDQRVKLEKPVHRPAAQLPPFHAEGTDDAKPQKKQQKECLADSSYRYDVHAEPISNHGTHGKITSDLLGLSYVTCCNPCNLCNPWLKLLINSWTIP